jgi:hypothetical protein
LTLIANLDSQNPRPWSLSAIFGRLAHLKQQASHTADRMPSDTGDAPDLNIAEWFGYFWHSILHTINLDIGWYQVVRFETSV